MRAVAHKRRKIEKRAKTCDSIESFLGRRPIPSILGPAGEFYIIDHHHLSLALWQADIASTFVTIIDDLSQLPMAMFWKRMEADGWLHPFDRQGRRIAPSRLPRRLDGLRHDPYRDLARSVREAGGYAKTSTPFAEFRWADYFRDRITERRMTKDYDAAVERAVALSAHRDARHLPGFTGAQPQLSRGR
jgi:hypothetical protein